MTFDPFGDFETRGYLRNLFGEKDPEIVSHIEYSSFVQGVNEALEHLSGIAYLSYKDVLDTHKTLFKDVYPWAGQDRLQTSPDIAVSKGNVLFAHPKDAHNAIEIALRLGQDKAFMTQKPGEVMGYLAYGHPFLDGNGRTFMVIHTELAHRAGISINWWATDKKQYLTALTHEIDQPGKGILDRYLKPFLHTAIDSKHLASHIVKTQGLAGGGMLADANTILGKVSDPALQARYKEQEQQRAAYKKQTKPFP
ncbi:MAG: Fic family protein [Nitrospirae bacterium]|nr:Fic family protein [Nitrospirota bacterium]